MEVKRVSLRTLVEMTRRRIIFAGRDPSPLVEAAMNTASGYPDGIPDPMDSLEIANLG